MPEAGAESWNTRTGPGCSRDRMQLTAYDAGRVAERATRPYGEWSVYAPMAYDGVGLVRIAGPQRDPRDACMSVSAYIHLLDGLPLRELDARAEDAVRELEGGAATVAVIDDSHRVDRIILLRNA